MLTNQRLISKSKCLIHAFIQIIGRIALLAHTIAQIKPKYDQNMHIIE